MKLNSIYKVLTLGALFTTVSIVQPVQMRVDARETLETDVVRVTASAPDNRFFTITIEGREGYPEEEGVQPPSQGNISLHFENINDFRTHGQQIAPVNNQGVSVSIDSHTNFTIAVEATGIFSDINDPESTLPLTHLRSRVSARYFEGAILNVPTDASVGTRNEVGIINSSHQKTVLTTTPREIIRNTRAHGHDITYLMQFDFLSDRDIPEGDFETTLRYTAWQN